MIKKITCFTLLLMMLLSMAMISFAEEANGEEVDSGEAAVAISAELIGEQPPRFVDLRQAMREASAMLEDGEPLLTEEQVRSLTTLLNEISERHQVDVSIVNTPSYRSTANYEVMVDGQPWTFYAIEGRDIADYTMTFFELNGFGMGANRDGIMFMISTSQREFDMATHGSAIAAFTDAGLELIEDRMMPDLRNDRFYEAFLTFAHSADGFLTQAAAGTPFDVNNMPTEPFPLVNILIGLGIGIILAFIVVAVMSSGMKSVF